MGFCFFSHMNSSELMSSLFSQAFHNKTIQIHVHVVQLHQSRTSMFRWLLLWCLLCWHSSLVAITHVDTDTAFDQADYVDHETFNIVLKNSVASMNDHIESVKLNFPSITITQVYWHLAQYNYLGYTAHIPTAESSSYQLTYPLKVFELVSEVRAAGSGSGSGEKLPYSPTFSRLDESSNLVGNGFCLISQETHRRHVSASASASDRRPMEGAIGARRAGEAGAAHHSAQNVVTVYVLDSGIDAQHPAFSGRVTAAAWSPPSRQFSPGASEQHPAPTYTPPSGHLDEETTGNRHAHGTQVASLIGGRGFGVNPDVRLVDVRVLDERGVGRTDDVLAALDFVTGQISASGDGVTRRLQSIINLSFSGASSQALKHALYAVSKMLLVVAAVGDDDSYACHVTPAQSPHILVVAATTAADLPREHSNYGDCIDVLAPGEAMACAAPWSVSTLPGAGHRSEGAEAEAGAAGTGAGAGAVSRLTGSSASAAIVTGFASLLFSALLENSGARQLLADTLNDDDISTFLRMAVIFNERTLVKVAHTETWVPECSLGTKENLLEMFLRSLHRLKENLTLNDPKRPKAFNNLKRNFASFTRKKNLGKYEE